VSRKLELVREEKLFRLLPGRKKSSRLEASGVALLDDTTALVIFDNQNYIASIDLSLENRDRNRLFPAPSLGSGFEDIAVDIEHGRAFCLIEALEDFDGVLRGFVAEYDRDGHFLRCSQLNTRFKTANKGFEGLDHGWVGGREYLYALCEGNLGTAAKRGGGRVDVFVRAPDGGWETSHQIRLPAEAEFEDYAALAYRDGQLAVASQASARVWVARIDEDARAVMAGSGKVYRFPDKSYGNVEGIAWLSPDTLVAVSDQKTKAQPARCAEKDQSIHVFRIPAD
jgi:hypothetical protein